MILGASSGVIQFPTYDVLGGEICEDGSSGVCKHRGQLA